MKNDKRILIDLNHAFDVHYFKNLYFILRSKGYTIKITASKKPDSFELLDELEIPFVRIGSYGKSFLSKALNLLWLDLKMIWIVLQFRPSLMLGHISFRVAHIGWLLRIKNYIFSDTDHATEQIRLYKYFSSKIITPVSFKGDFGDKHIRMKTIYELAYLHPKYFKPNNKNILPLNINIAQPVFLLRFVSWDATHDKGHHGLSTPDKKKLISYLSNRGQVFISSEDDSNGVDSSYNINIPKKHLHDLIANSTIYIGEGGTMASEAAVLGIPSVFTNSLTMGYTEELENKWGLLKRTTDLSEIISFVDAILSDHSARVTWQEKRNKMLDHLENPTDKMLEMIENEFSALT